MIFWTDKNTPLLSLTNFRRDGENKMTSGLRMCTFASQGAKLLCVSVNICIAYVIPMNYNRNCQKNGNHLLNEY